MIVVEVILAILFVIGLLGDFWNNQPADVSIFFSSMAFSSGFVLILLLAWPEVAL